MYVYLNFFADSFQLGLSIREYLSLFLLHVRDLCSCRVAQREQLQWAKDDTFAKGLKNIMNIYVGHWVSYLNAGKVIWSELSFFHPARKHGKILNRATLWFTNKWGMSTLKYLNLTKKDQKRTSLGAFKRQNEHELVLKWIKMDMKRNWNGPKMSLNWTKIRLFMEQKKA